MSFIYKICLLYPYWFLKTLIHWIFQLYKNIFCLHIDENKIDHLTGFEFELLIQKLLIKSGYHSVKITQASGDYGIDLLAKKNQVSYGFQCKRYQKNIGVSAIQQAYGGISYYHLDCAIVITNSYFTEAAYQLASVNDIILIDRPKLLKMLKKAKLFSSQIPLYCYVVDLIIICLFYYLHFQYQNFIYLSIFLIHLLLFIYMFFKTLRYKKYNQIKEYTIHDYQ